MFNIVLFIAFIKVVITKTEGVIKYALSNAYNIISNYTKSANFHAWIIFLNLSEISWLIYWFFKKKVNAKTSSYLGIPNFDDLWVIQIGSYMFYFCEFYWLPQIGINLNLSIKFLRQNWRPPGYWYITN